VLDHRHLAQRIEVAFNLARQDLLASRNCEGVWTGDLSSSALSTATAICALSIAERNSTTLSETAAPLIQRGLDWLAEHVNTDGGWGDTVFSMSNTSTTALCWAAFGAVPGADARYGSTVASAQEWLSQHAGGIDPEQLAPAIIQRYGKDRTFSVPILTMCTLAGRLGSGSEAWRWVLPLPFELAACPHQWFAALRLPVVSYALPALIAIGQARHHHRPSRNPIARLCRNSARARTLRVLREIQPSSGGFLEATPLTSFVVMSLAASGQADHETTRKGVEFLMRSARADGSWPIDTNLATWVTTLSINALCGSERANLESSAASLQADPAAQSGLQLSERCRIRDWLLAQQYRNDHPYTHAAPGGWAWTNLPGGVPDADDTAGALLALFALGGLDERTRASAAAGVEWLLGLQNRDGGIPTFCKGWGALPFDRSSPDLTAHALRAWGIWIHEMPWPLQQRLNRAIPRALQYLANSQTKDGSWIPLWFGNQFVSDDKNPTYGTTRVIPALRSLASRGFLKNLEPLKKGIEWLVQTQDADGGWGGAHGSAPSIEETALALEALAEHASESEFERSPSIDQALSRGANWLLQKIEDGYWRQPAPIGFYFAKLWYYERLYPIIFTVAALQRLRKYFGELSTVSAAEVSRFE
jgi:squalene-hopene/tetraprenyl-beta-curcumene cyclase